MDESGSLRPLRLAALQLANDARSGRAELKRQIAAGSIRVADVLSQRQREVLAAELRALDPLAARLRERSAARPLTTVPPPPAAP
jgi:hypothetical protein